MKRHFPNPTTPKKSKRPSPSSDPPPQSHLNSFLHTLHAFSSHAQKARQDNLEPNYLNRTKGINETGPKVPAKLSGSSKAPHTTAESLFHDAYNLFTRKQYAQSLHLFLLTLQKSPNHKFALYYCGYLYLKQREYVSAMAYLKKALKENHASAAYHLGVMYENGWGVEKNDEVALAYFEFAAKREHAASMLNAAILRSRNAQGDSDLCVAKEWLERASEHGIVGSVVSKRKFHAYMQVIEGLRTLRSIRNSLREGRVLKREEQELPLQLTFEKPMCPPQQSEQKQAHTEKWMYHDDASVHDDDVHSLMHDLTD